MLDKMLVAAVPENQVVREEVDKCLKILKNTKPNSGGGSLIGGSSSVTHKTKALFEMFQMEPC